MAAELAGFVALQEIAGNDEYRKLINLTAQSRVVLLSTEGNTAPGIYRDLVGQDGSAVLAAQKAWLEQYERV